MTRSTYDRGVDYILQEGRQIGRHPYSCSDDDRMAVKVVENTLVADPRTNEFIKRQRTSVSL